MKSKFGASVTRVRGLTGLGLFRKFGAPISGATLFFFAESALAPAVAWAQSGAPAASDKTDSVSAADKATLVHPTDSTKRVAALPVDPPTASDPAADPSAPGAKPAKGDATAVANAQGGAKTKQEAPVTAPANQVDSLPTGGDKSGVTSKAISLPQGSGKIQGMGESFSAQLSTGIATFSVPFALPHARGGAQPSLGLSYSSSGGFGLAGVGWDVGVPFIARQTDRGLPSYADNSGFDPNQDRFVFNGGQELVPICVVGSGTGGGGLSCAGALPNEAMPSWSAGSQYFRPRVEGSFLRFFWSSNHKTWRVQDKSGITMELGVPLDSPNDMLAVDANPQDANQIFRWHLVRQYDTYGDNINPSDPLTAPAPKNVVIYKYVQNGGMAYVSDIYDTSPAVGSAPPTLSLFAHHTHLNYQPRTDPTFSFHSGWRMDQTLRLAGVDVTSKSYNEGPTGPRHLVRRYHLAYDPSFHASLLSSVQVEGRCSGEEVTAPAEQAELLPAETGCGLLPAMTFDYSHVPGTPDLPGYEAFDDTVRSISSSPTVSVDNETADLLDINSDGLPDVLDTAVGTYGNGHGVFFNSPGGTADSFGAPSLMTVAGVLGANANTITFRNLNLAALDLNGDGTIDLLHMPQIKTYSQYTPKFVNGAWSWNGVAVTTASGQSPKIDFGNDTTNTKVLDVNGDGLVDVLVSTGTEYETFLSLGRFPQGDGQFGNGGFGASATVGQLSNEPLRACVPWSATPVQLSDPDVKLADMNGDGLPDIVRLRRGDIRYWPGRGDGTWGTGARSDCKSNTFSSNGFIAMTASPEFSDIQQASLLIDDVNGDGLDDLVEVLNTAPSGTTLKNAVGAIEVWLNVDGNSWTGEHIQGTTFPFTSRVRLVDVNGSGTRDIFSASGGRYAYIDLQAGAKPWLLTGVKNGLGKSTTIEYSTSTAEMLAAESLPACDANTLAQSPWGCRWQSKMPTIAHIVKRVTESDNIPVAGTVGSYVTEYQYRDPLFEGRQREFRGFARARSKKIGDVNSPSSFTESAFLLGECEDETPNDGVDDCGLGERWRDNPREALKGLPIFTTTYDEQGLVLSTDYSTYRLRNLYTGMDGRAVRQAFESDKQAILYDTARGPQSGGAPRSINAVYLETGGPGATPTVSRTESVPIAGASGTAEMSSQSVEDYFGNKTEGIDNGCVAGDSCPTAGNGIAANETLHSVTDPGTVPLASNTGHWLWRTNESYVTGSAHAGVKRNDIKTSYTDEGAPKSTQALLSGVEALDRYHASGGAVAPAPLNQSSGTFTASSLYYDAFGNVVAELGPDGMDKRRCRLVSYEGSLDAKSYAESPTSETIYVDGCTTQTTGLPSGQGTSLTTTAMYDRGLGVVALAMDMTGQTSLASYDEFGRITEVRRPHANGAIVDPGDVPSVAIDYTLPSDTNRVAFSIIHTRTQDGTAENDSSKYLESYSYVDGLGRTRAALNEADISAGDDTGWIASSIVSYDAKGAARRKYLAYFSSESPTNFSVGATPAQPYGSQRYDAFGRQLQTFDLDGTVTLHSVYHALSTDLYDAADLESGPHQGTYASSAKDGHGRAVSTTERIHAGTGIETREVRTQYLPTGEPEVITRYSPGKPLLTRWMRYDSLGRMTLNVDPHTSFNFTTDTTASSTPSTVANSTTTLRVWRYAYDNAGDLIGTSDARGCGENFTYDGAGRLTGEDYSPCNANQGTYTAPVTATGAGFEVSYFYDQFTAPSSLPTGTTPPGYQSSSPYLAGRLAAVLDRGQATWTTYDARGRVVQTDKRLAKPLTTASLSGPITQVLSKQLFTKTFSYDAADREVSASTGAQSAELLVTPAGGSNAESVVTTAYTARGTVASVSSSYGSLVTKVVHSADGLVKNITYGDIAGTETNNTYDARRRLYMVETDRTPPGIWSQPQQSPAYTPAPAFGGTPAPPPTTLQSTLQFNRFTYDVVGNPTEIEDLRVPEEWPAGSKPVTRKVEYDDLYRATKVSYQYSTGDDTWISPDAPDLAGASDVRRAQPMPHVTFTTRPRWQSYQYDWLGTISNSDDDQHASYDRSLGPVTTNVATGKPYQLHSATQPTTGPNITGTNTRAGGVSAAYDRAGFATSFDLQSRATTVPCVPASGCRYRVDLSFDEVGRLQWAKRWDYAASAYGLSLYYQYDASDERVSKVSVDSLANTRDTEYVFGSLELHRTTYNSTTNVYNLKDASNANLIYEVPYLEAHGVRLARLAYDSSAVPDQPHFAAGSGRLHVFFELGDHLGSTSAVLDQATSELVELGTYQPYGATESDYRPDRWKGFREDYRFTGKEEDIEVGLEYFGKRYLNPYLGVWVSADPLGVHSPGKGDLNLYAYVNGRLLVVVDPVGLAGLLSALWDSAKQGSFGPASPVGQELAHGDYPTLQDDKALTQLQHNVIAATVGIEAALVTGGAAAEVLGAGTLGSGAIGGAIGGAYTRGTGAALNGATPIQQLHVAVSDPATVASDALMGAGTTALAEVAKPVIGKVTSGVPRWLSDFMKSDRGAGAPAPSNLDLHADAVAARDQLAADLAGTKHPPATVVGAYSPSTGEVVAGASRGGGLGCAEGVCNEALGSPEDIQFTQAIRPRTGQTVDVCEQCEESHGRDAFPDPATKYKSDTKKE